MRFSLGDSGFSTGRIRADRIRKRRSRLALHAEAAPPPPGVKLAALAECLRRHTVLTFHRRGLE